MKSSIPYTILTDWFYKLFTKNRKPYAETTPFRSCTRTWRSFTTKSFAGFHEIPCDFGKKKINLQSKREFRENRRNTSQLYWRSSSNLCFTFHKYVPNDWVSWKSGQVSLCHFCELKVPAYRPTEWYLESKEGPGEICITTLLGTPFVVLL